MIQLIREWEIDCELVNAGSVSFKMDADFTNRAHTASSTQTMDATELQQKMGVDNDSYTSHGGVFYPKACRIWPAKLVRGVAHRLQSDYGSRVRIIEHMTVDGVICGSSSSSDVEERCTVKIAGGKAIRCKHVVVATNGWTSKLLPELSDWIFPCKNQVWVASKTPSLFS